jgi:predicted ester cyclase
MSVEENKATVRRFFTEVARGGIPPETLRSEIERTIAPDYVDHDSHDPENGREVLLRALPELFRALPDLRFTVEQLIGEGDMVAVRLRGEATHTGEGMGTGPTGKRITWTENELFRLKNGQMVESWGEGDTDAALAGIGLGFEKA